MTTPSNDSKTVSVRRARVVSIDIYEIKDSELEILEKGEPAAVQLNFAIFLLSLAFSSIATLSTAAFESDIIQDIFVFVFVIGILGGAYLLIQWRRSRTSVRDVVKRVRERMTDDLPDVEETNGQSASRDEPPPSENEPVG